VGQGADGLGSGAFGVGTARLFVLGVFVFPGVLPGLEEGVLVNRLAVRLAEGHPFGGHGFAEEGAGNSLELVGVVLEEVVVVAAAGDSGIVGQRFQAAELAELTAQVGGALHLFGELLLQFGELCVEQGALEVGEAVVGRHLVEVVEPLVFQAAQVVVAVGAVPVALGAAENDSAFAAGESLGLLEAEGAVVAVGADSFVAPLGALAVGAVFDEGEFVFAGDFDDAVEVGGVAAEVDDENGTGARRNGRFDGIGVRLQGERVAVDEDGDGVEGEDGGGGDDEGEGGDDYLVAGLDAGGVQGEFYGDGAVGAGEGVAAVVVVGEGALELAALAGGLGFDGAAAPPLAAAKDFEEGAFVGFVDDRPLGGDWFGEDFGASPQG